MSDKTRGYNFVMKVGAPGAQSAALLVAGHTDASYDITPEIEETLIKANLGVKQLEVIGTDEQFTVDMLQMIKATGESASHYDFVDLRKACRAGSTLPFSYGWHASGKPICTGNVMIMKYNEKNGASGIGTASVTVKVIGSVTDTTFSS
jgi:hypothetical protein